MSLRRTLAAGVGTLLLVLGAAAPSTATSTLPTSASLASDPTTPPGTPAEASDPDDPSVLPVPPAPRRGERSTTAVPQPLTLGPAVQLATGSYLRTFSEVDERGGYIGKLIAINLGGSTKVRADHAFGGRVTTRATLDRLVGPNAVAAINGDFFDISTTGAPRGFGISRTRGILHGRDAGWSNAFWTTRGGSVGLGRLDLQARLVEFPGLPVSAFNSGAVANDSIGLYSSTWGASVDARQVTSGAGGVRTVVVQNGRVVLNSPTPVRSVPVGGYVLVARGAAVAQALQMPYGTVVTPRVVVPGNVAFAVGASGPLVQGGRIVNRSDATLAPRTVVAYDRDAHRLLLFVVDGRSTRSRGVTHLEAAEIATWLGADEALNLDGGGSTTMLARVGGRMVTVNQPSDGSRRAVPNGIQIGYP
ncbi:MAG TPA: phosphodiester glycosidase family protein [Nocardioides sp.]